MLSIYTTRTVLLSHTTHAQAGTQYATLAQKQQGSRAQRCLSSSMHCNAACPALLHPSSPSHKLPAACGAVNP